MVLHSFHARCPFIIDYFLTFIQILLALGSVAYATGPQETACSYDGNTGDRQQKGGGHRTKETEASPDPHSMGRSPLFPTLTSYLFTSQAACLCPLKNLTPMLPEPRILKWL